MSDSLSTLDFDLDRRETQRHPCHLKVFCKPFEDRCNSEAWPAEVSDLSQSGARFLLERRFEKGSLLVLELRHIEADISVTLPVRIMRIRATGSLWELGCAFAGRLDSAEIDALIERPKGAAPERRAA